MPFGIHGKYDFRFDKIPNGELYKKFNSRIKYPDHFDNDCLKFGLSLDEGLRKLCSCGHVTKRHRWIYSSNTAVLSTSACEIRNCPCEYWRRELGWAEVCDAFADPPPPPPKAPTPEILEKKIHESAIVLRKKEAEWLAFIHKEMPRKKAEETIPLKQHKECKLFRCLKCWKLILQDDEMEQYNDGYVHKICLERINRRSWHR